MIHFNELRVTPDRKALIIDVVVRNEEYYDDVYLDKIVIDNQFTFVNNGKPSSHPIYDSSTVPLPVAVFKPKKNMWSDDMKHIRLELTHLDLRRPLSDMFFVYVITKGNPAPDTPCGFDNRTTLGTVIDMYPFYQTSINMLKELTECCEVPQHFIDYMLRIKALELAIKTGNYVEAIKFYFKFFNRKSRHLSIKGGGCCCGK